MYFTDDKDEKIWKVVSIILIFGAITCFILTIITSFVLSAPQDYLKEIIDNFQDYPFLDISEKTHNTCPQRKLSFGIWPGTFSGCDCRYHFPNSGCVNKICSGKCNVNETRAGCDTIEPIPSIPIEKWRKTQFCMRNYSNNYEELLDKTIKNGEECPTNFKKCGTRIIFYVCLLLKNAQLMTYS